MSTVWVRRMAPSLIAVAVNLAYSPGTFAGRVAAAAPTVTPLMTRELAAAPDKEALMITVTYAPGGASLPHRHDAQVFVYVLEGAMTMQVDGGAPVTLKRGQVFYEGPDDVHRISANASRTAPAKILVLMIKDKGRPPSRAVGPEEAR
jgi:quercetin dioxygenase-like cupin family protein